MKTSQPAAATVPTKSRTNAYASLVIEPDPVLDRHRHGNGVAHRLDAIGDDRRLRHQARAEAARLHALGRAAAIEIDLVVAPALAESRAGGELAGIAAAELQRERMLGRVEIEVVRDVAVRERPARDHLGVEARARRDEAQEEPAVPVGPVHHRRDAEAMRRDRRGERRDTRHVAGPGPEWTAVVRPSQNGARSSRFSVLPAALRGNASSTSTRSTR